MEPRIDVHLLNLNEPAEWRETCIASLEGAPIQLHVLPGIPGRIGEARAAGYAQGTLPLVATAPEHRLAAIVDFTFNLGAGRLQTSTLRRRINQRDWHNAAQELRRWVYGGGKVLPGLVARRQAEISCLCP
jgi:Phage lysozyme